MTSRPSVARLARRPLAVAVLAVAAVLSAILVTASGAPSRAATTELVANSTFADGMANWSTGRWGQQATPVRRDGAHVIQLTTSRTQNISLNDVPNSVRDSGPAGTTYRVSTRIRTNAPGVTGALRVVERSGEGNTTHLETFTLDTNGWATVTLRFTTQRRNAELDLSVVAWRLPKGDKVFVRYVSMQRLDAGAPPPPTNDPCSNPVPSGTTFGTSISSVGQSAEESLRANDQRFGELGVVRDYFPGLPAAWNSSRMRIHADRDVVVSFKATPQAILSGRHDAFFRNWFATVPRDRVVYWSFHHEPEGEVKKGDFTAAQYRRAWERLDGFRDEVCKPNLHATLILSAWTSMPQARPALSEYDAGPDVIDVLAFDPYNRIFEPNSDQYDPPEKVFRAIVDVMRRDGRPVGIAELGSRRMRGDGDGSGRAAWLESMGQYAIDNGLTFVSYFQSTNGADWRLLENPEVRTWRGFIAQNP